MIERNVVKLKTNHPDVVLKTAILSASGNVTLEEVVSYKDYWSLVRCFNVSIQDLRKIVKQYERCKIRGF